MTYELHTRLSLAGDFVGLSHGLFGAGNVVHSLDTVIQDPSSSEVRPTPGDGSGNPFLTATYADVSSGQGSVRLTLEATGLADGEFASNPIPEPRRGLAAVGDLGGGPLPSSSPCGPFRRTRHPTL